MYYCIPPVVVKFRIVGAMEKIRASLSLCSFDTNAAKLDTPFTLKIKVWSINNQHALGIVECCGILTLLCNLANLILTNNLTCDSVAMIEFWLLNNSLTYIPFWTSNITMGIKGRIVMTIL